MAQPLFIDRRTAAALCHCSTYTLRRYDRRGKLPNRRVGDDGLVRYAVSDLVAAGLLDPTATLQPLPESAIHKSVEAAVTDVQSELAAARAQIAELNARLARAEDEVAFLRQLVQRSAVA